MTIQINQNILFFTNSLIIADTFVQIEGVNIPWNQIIHFKYEYGPKKIIPQGGLSQLTYFFTPKENREIYVEHIEVRGHFNGKIYSFFHSGIGVISNISLS